MTNSEYKSIRGEKDFLYRYFVKQGGNSVGDQAFNMGLSAWCSVVIGMHISKAVPIIVNYLDKKFGYTSKNS